jgi:Right handed beta helix region
MRVRRRAYLIALCVAALAVTPFLAGAASAKTSKPPTPKPPSKKPVPKSAPTITTSTPVTCGGVVTTSITLSGDVNCSGSGTNGINVGANSITINLNGHTLSGDGTHYGVYNSGFTGVVVQNGVISDFDYGIVNFGNSSKGQSLRLDGNASAGIFSEANSDVFTGSYFTSNFDGILVYPGSGDQVTNNWFESNTSVGLYALGPTGMVLSGNKALNTSGDGFGIIAVSGTGQVTGNVANGNATYGIYLDNPSATSFKSGVTATNNRAAFNAGFGIWSSPAGSVDGNGNVVQDNGNAAQCANIVCHEVSN